MSLLKFFKRIRLLFSIYSPYFNIKTGLNWHQNIDLSDNRAYNKLTTDK